MARRSKHIAINVPGDRVDGAVAHYEALLGVTEVGRDESGVELKGQNFTIWISSETDKPKVMQEWAVSTRNEALKSIAGSEAQLIGESKVGYYITDPYGLDFHFYVEPEDQK